MEWERCKNILIIFFIILNIALGLLFWYENRKYNITIEQERMIRAIMFQNQINMYDSLIRQHRPMSSLYIGEFSHDGFKDIFFTGNFNTIYDNDMLIMEDNTGRLTIYESGFIVFDNHSRFNDPLGFINEHFPDFVLDSNIGEWLTFRQVYNNMIVHSNTIEILVIENNIKQIEIFFGDIIGSTGENQEIFSSVLALFSFIQRARSIFYDTPIIITRMDLVYFQDHMESNLAVPYYRIFIEGNDMPFLVNALTNVIMY